VPRRGAVTQEEAMAIIVEAALEFVVRDVAGNRTPTRRVPSHRIDQPDP